MDQLNKEQKDAVYCSENIVLVKAPAGTGKTRVLTERILYLIKEKGVDPESILAITFTNLAADEMKKRIHDLEKIPAYKFPPNIGTTCHIFCEIVRRDIDKLSLPRFLKYNFEVLDPDVEQIEFISGAIRHLKLKKDFDFEKVKKDLSALKLDQEFDLGFELNYEQSSLERILWEYKRRLIKGNRVDFDDIFVYAHQILSKFPEVLNHWKSKYKYIFVDECQDLSEPEFRLINLLVCGNDGCNFFAVGDTNQCIYGFRGAKEDIFAEYLDLFGKENVKEISLVENYRSTQKIVEKSKTLQVIGTETSSARKVKNPSDILNIDASQLEKLIIEAKKNGELNKWVILYRNHSMGGKIMKSLVKKGIDFRLAKCLFLAGREGRGILQLFKFLCVIYFDDLHPIFRILYKDLFCDILQSNKNVYPDVNLFMESGFIPEKWKPFFDELKRLRSIEDKSDLVYMAKECHKMCSKLIEKTKWLDFLWSWLETIQYEKTLDSAEDIIMNLRHYVELSKEDINIRQHNYLTLSTIHKTKGLEWDCVAIVGYDELQSSFESRDKENKNLAYVAITRARDRLFLTEK